MGGGLRPTFALDIPPGVPFDQPEHEAFTWDVALNADELIGLLGTLERDHHAARRTTRTRDHRSPPAPRASFWGSKATVTVDVTFRADCFRSRLR